MDAKYYRNIFIELSKYKIHFYRDLIAVFTIILLYLFPLRDLNTVIIFVWIIFKLKESRNIQKLIDSNLNKV